MRVISSAQENYGSYSEYAYVKLLTLQNILKNVQWNGVTRGMSVDIMSCLKYVPCKTRHLTHRKYRRDEFQSHDRDKYVRRRMYRPMAVKRRFRRRSTWSPLLWRN
jgi:hypothetical protein